MPLVKLKRMKVFLSVHLKAVFALLLLSSCSFDSQRRELTPFELEHGIGPVFEVIELGELDFDLSEKGKEIFFVYCAMCHGYRMNEVAPDLDHILDRRSAEYIMNMILNPAGMNRQHPSRTQSMQGYLTSMPYQQLNLEDARAIVEFFRFNPVLYDSE